MGGDDRVDNAIRSPALDRAARAAADALAWSSRRGSSRGDGANAKLDSRPSAITGPRTQAPYCNRYLLPYPKSISSMLGRLS